MSNDRRSGEERRGLSRFPLDVVVEWETQRGRQPGSMSDISLEGCFVLGSGDVTDGEFVKIFVPIADGMKVQFNATIANHVLEIGFGAKFEPLSTAQRELIAKLVERTR
jgi:hypothetical protein